MCRAGEYYSDGFHSDFDTEGMRQPFRLYNRQLVNLSLAKGKSHEMFREGQVTTLLKNSDAGIRAM